MAGGVFSSVKSGLLRGAFFGMLGKFFKSWLLGHPDALGRSLGWRQKILGLSILGYLAWKLIFNELDVSYLLQHFL